MSPSQTVLVTAAAGNIGKKLVPLLLDHDYKLVLPTSNAARLRSLLPPNSEGKVAVEQGSIRDPNWISSVLRTYRAEIVFLCVNGSDELITTLNFLDAMQRAGCVKHVVYISACGDFTSSGGVQETMRTMSTALALVKSTIELKLLHGGYPWTCTRLGATLFFTEDLQSKDSMLKDGLIGEPLGEMGVSRVAPTDIAQAACNAIVYSERWSGRKVMVGSLQRYAGSFICKLWSNVLGREIRMTPADVENNDMFEAEVLRAIDSSAEPSLENSAWVRVLRLMYEGFQQYGFGMTEEDYKTQVELLGREPHSYEEWVTETAKSWL